MLPLLFALVLAHPPPGDGCGVELRSLKTLTDRDASAIGHAPERTTVERLVQLSPPPEGHHRRRCDIEKKSFEVVADIVGFKEEKDDRDFHVVLAGESGATLIAELPDPACAEGSPVQAEISAARKTFLDQIGTPMRGVFRKLKHPIRVKIVGVAFFDRLHGQRGVAPNGIELHPVLSIERLDSR